MTAEKRKIVLRISICPTSLEQGDQGETMDEVSLLAAIESVTAERWPGCEVVFKVLQVGLRQGDAFAECWVDGVRNDEQAQQLLEDVDYSDENLYQ